MWQDRVASTVQLLLWNRVFQGTLPFVFLSYLEVTVGGQRVSQVSYGPLGT